MKDLLWHLKCNISLFVIGGSISRSAKRRVDTKGGFDATLAYIVQFSRTRVSMLPSQHYTSCNHRGTALTL